MGLYDAASRAFGGFFHTGDPEDPPPLHKNPWALFVLAGLLLPPLLYMTGLTVHRPPVPEVVATLPDFALVDQDGEPFTRADLADAVHITGFFFTSCQAECPRILTVMKGIQDDIEVQEAFAGYAGQMKLLAISVDPERDTPEKLRETMATYGLDPARFTMLTGDRDAVHALVTGGFALAVGEATETAPGVFDIAHSSRLAIVDGDGGVRGFYGLEPVSGDIGLTGARLNTDFDGPAAVRGWATIVLQDQRRR
jgi:protein SCO1/2